MGAAIRRMNARIGEAAEGGPSLRGTAADRAPAVAACGHAFGRSLRADRPLAWPASRATWSGRLETEIFGRSGNELDGVLRQVATGMSQVNILGGKDIENPRPDR